MWWNSPIPDGAPKDTKPIVADFSEKGVAATLIQDRPDVIFHLAAIVSGDAEANFEKGYRINFNGSWALFEAIRQEGEKEAKQQLQAALCLRLDPGGDRPALPRSRSRFLATTPTTSYGTQKAMTELLLADYSRKGYLDGVGVRLPTICIRPGKPNKAASSFFSGILREPLAGQEAPLPVGDEVRHWFASPRAPRSASSSPPPPSIPRRWGVRRSMTMPGVSATVGEEIEALRKAAGDKAVALIKRVDDPFVAKIVQGWAGRYDAAAGHQHGLQGGKEFRRDHQGLSGRRDGPMRFSRRSESFRHWPAACWRARPAPSRASPADDDDDPPMPLKLVVLDIGGTLIGDHGEVPDAMLGAFSRHGITVTPAEFSEWRGASKRGMVQHFVEQRGRTTGGRR